MAALSRAEEFALAKDGRDCDFQLKPEQKKIIDAVVCRKKDVLGILPTGFGKSLIFHLLSNVFDFMEAGSSREREKHHNRHIATKCADARPDQQTWPRRQMIW